MIQVISLAGEPRTRGVAYGQAAAARIRAHMADWLAAMGEAARQVDGDDGEAYVRDLLNDTDFISAASLHTPDLLEEVRGIADGADVSADLLFALQLIDEEWAYRGRWAGAHGSTLHKCSSVAIVAAGGPTWIGQNMDLGPYTDTHQVMLQIAGEAGRPGALILTVAGVIGLLGVNAAGSRSASIRCRSFPTRPSGRLSPS